ncbi:ABC transporter permease [Sphingobacterium sp. DN00404]|uniref:ABC transporter permease n=1 Tax=Sphingobacterium micropteri TaxID=2763501 RepID=A0ABR7YSC7_9SPHI|nr:FtsX-like permease family protein [Sphingobacterium micropteri]MBD1434162.1 ABC transporter permease [Sphingobacterium micropteri]
MIKNHFKIAWRNLLKNKGNSTINILGLALGMSISLIIGLWISSEVQYDRFYSKTDRISQVYTRDTFEGKSHTWGGTPAVLGPILKQEHPEIEEVVRTATVDHLLHNDEKRFKASGIVSDPGFFTIFDFSFLAGNPENALLKPDAIIITESLAKKMFGHTDVIGRIVKIDTLASMAVQGVIQDIPYNSIFRGNEFFCSWDLLKITGWIVNDNWTNYNHETYALLKEGVSLSSTNQNIANLVKNHTNNQVKASIYLYPANRWHLYNKSENGKMVAGTIITLRMFALIGLFILLIACINFINLSTAGAERRAKEVGVRKVVGAPKKTLIQQFLLESFLITLLAGSIALLLTAVGLPFFNTLINGDIRISDQPIVFWGLLVAVIVIATLGAGIYPAFVLSAFEPIRTLKGNLVSAKGNFRPRKVLVTLQFTISICLGICTIIISQQIRHAQNRDNGYDQNNLVYVALEGDLRKNYTIIRNELVQHGVASSVTKSLGRITGYTSNSWGYSWPNAQPEDFDVTFNIMSTDTDFGQTMGIKLVKGRDIDVYTHPSDSNAVLLNQKAVERMRLINPLGTQIIEAQGTEYETTWHVVGVIEDFILQSPYQDIEPMMVKGPASYFSYIHIRLNTANSLLSNMDQLQAILKKYNPDYPVDIHFADEAYALKFKQQKRTATLTALFSGLAIFIACLGLFGLVSFATIQRQKEIGIRKVLGASVAAIATMLSKDFLKLVVLAIIIASPIAWWIMNRWLQDFVYRIDIQWWTFFFAGVLAILIALFTVSTLAVKAARTNPVNSLRDE